VPGTNSIDEEETIVGSERYFWRMGSEKNRTYEQGSILEKPLFNAENALKISIAALTAAAVFKLFGN